VKKRRVVGLAAAIVILAATARWWPDWYWTYRTRNPVRAGAELAAKNGCLACHAPLQREQHADPGSRWGSVPSFYRGNLMMYVQNPKEVEDFISYGRPEAPPKKRGAAAPSAPSAAGRKAAPLFHMPAFKGRLSSSEVHNLALYVMAADGYQVPDSGTVADGFTLSRKYGCESCHGIGGSGGVLNPRSFTLTVPGWIGPDFSSLVRNKEEFREWVMEGRSNRMAHNPAASFFLDRANIYMPSFRDVLKPQDVDALWAYVQFLRDQPWGRAGAPK
jgi:mono/diheme cytochrome c family protein